MRLLLSLCSNAFSVSGKMLFPFLTAALLLMSVTSCKKETLATVSSDDLKAASSLSAANAANASTSLPNFGAWISGFTIDQKVNGCQQLQVAYVRDAIILKDFDGKSISVDNYTSKGYKVVLNLIYENLPDKKPTPFPTNMAEYKNLLNKVLDKYQPEIAVIENEPTTDIFHTGSMDDYITELKTAVDVCKQRGIKVADGGLNLQQVEKVMKGLKSNDRNYVETKQLLDVYKTIDLDYVNIHTHAPFSEHGNQDVFEEGTLKSVADYIRTEIGKEVICNEYNQRNNSQKLMNSAVNAFASAGIKYFIAHSNDHDGKAKSLYNGSNLTSLGDAYKNAIK
jgi:hypothetical protein